jgi:hypothetical protein
MKEAVVARLFRLFLYAALISAGFTSVGLLTLTRFAIAQTSCAESAGPEQARRYVEQCLEVSPATHPPCNTANACALIQDEIRRGCGFLGKDAPAFCQQYKQPG